MPDCPMCHAPMAAETRDGVSVEVCAHHGLWLDKHELFQITEHERYDQGGFSWHDIFRRPLHPPEHERRRLDCPHCHHQMIVTPYHEVSIDWCPQHGVWLDNGELEAILNNLRLDPTYLRGVAIRFKDAEY